MPQSPSLCYKQGERLGSSVAHGPKTTDEAEDGADVGPVVVAAATDFGRRQRRVDPDARGVESQARFEEVPLRGSAAARKRREPDRDDERTCRAVPIQKPDARAEVAARENGPRKNRRGARRVDASGADDGRGRRRAARHDARARRRAGPAAERRATALLQPDGVHLAEGGAVREEVKRDLDVPRPDARAMCIIVTTLVIDYEAVTQC